MMDWVGLGYDLGYVVVALLAIYLSGWLIYDKVATRGYCLSKALFQDRNMAAGIEIVSFVFIEVMIALSAMSGESITKMDESGEMVVHLWRDYEAIALTIVFANLTFFFFRFLASFYIKTHFKGQLDNHGEEVTYNNEIYVQHNVGAALFSASFLIVMYFMIYQEDFLNTRGYRLESYVNMAVVFLSGVVSYLLYNIFFIARGHGLLKELFIDNNSGVGLSLLGFMFSVLFLQSRITLHFVQGEHFFKTEASTYIYLVLLFAFVVILRKFFILVMDLITKRKFVNDFLVEDNPVAGLLDMTYMISVGLLLARIL